MAIPKIDRDSGIFEPPVCDRINKKVQLIQNNIGELTVPNLDPRYDVIESPAHIDTDQLYSHYHRDAYWSTDPTTGQQTYHPEVNHTMTCVPKFYSNTSFSIGSDYSKVNFINMTIDLTNVKYDGSAFNNGYISLDGKMDYLCKVQKAPVCDVWFAAEDGLCIFHIPAGRTEMYILVLDYKKSVEIYTYYV